MNPIACWQVCTEQYMYIYRVRQIHKSTLVLGTSIIINYHVTCSPGSRPVGSVDAARLLSPDVLICVCVISNSTVFAFCAVSLFYFLFYQFNRAAAIYEKEHWRDYSWTIFGTNVVGKKNWQIDSFFHFVHFYSVSSFLSSISTFLDINKEYNTITQYTYIWVLDWRKSVTGTNGQVYPENNQSGKFNMSHKENVCIFLPNLVIYVH